MTSSRPPFRPRMLLNPFYLARRLREMRSFGEFAHAAANVFVLARNLLRNFGYELRGLKHLAAARSASAYYRVRGAAIRLAAKAESAYYELRGLTGYFRQREPCAPSLSTAPAARPAPQGPLALVHPDVVRERAALAARFQEGQPFKHVVIDGFLDPDFCRMLASAFPRYDPEAFRNEHGHLGKATHENVAELGPSYRKLDQLLQAPEFLRLIGDITGIDDLLHDPDYVGGGTHENLEGMELDPHVDFTVHRKSGFHRRVNMLIYLNPEWDDAWGGALELHVNPWLPPERNPIRTILPLFNRCVLFETSDHSWHGFSPIRLPRGKEGLSRKSFAAYLYSRDRPKGFPAIPGDLTVFVDRPLPKEIRPGLTLSDRELELLRHLIVRRDWKLKYLYERAISLYGAWSSSQEELVRAREALRRAESEKSALANDLRLSEAQLRESLAALLRANDQPKG